MSELLSLAFVTAVNVVAFAMIAEATTKAMIEHTLRESSPGYVWKYSSGGISSASVADVLEHRHGLRSSTLENILLTIAFIIAVGISYLEVTHPPPSLGNAQSPSLGKLVLLLIWAWLLWFTTRPGAQYLFTNRKRFRYLTLLVVALPSVLLLIDYFFPLTWVALLVALVVQCLGILRPLPDFLDSMSASDEGYGPRINNLYSEETAATLFTHGLVFVGGSVAIWRLFDVLSARIWIGYGVALVGAIAPTALVLYLRMRILKRARSYPVARTEITVGEILALLLGLASSLSIGLAFYRFNARTNFVVPMLLSPVFGLSIIGITVVVVWWEKKAPEKRKSGGLGYITAVFMAALAFFAFVALGLMVLVLHGN